MRNNLIDNCIGIFDCEHKTAPISNTGYPSIRTPNIGRGRLNFENINLVSEETWSLWTKRAIPEHLDLIIAREAPAGNVALVPKDSKICLGQRTVLIKPDHNKIDPAFLCYYLLSPRMQHELLSKSAGSTVPHINVKDIKFLNLFNLPTLPTQRKIASILSAYDDLIENNLKRIKLLEELAQRTYEEWFVKFRVKGEKLKVNKETGLPEGWEKKKLSDVANFIFGYPFNANDFNASRIGTPIIRIRNIPKSDTQDFTTQVVDSKYIINKGDLLVGMDGEFYVNNWCGPNAYLVQRSCKIEAKNPKHHGYLTQAIVSPIKFYEATISGATVAHLGKKHLDEIEINIPLDLFDQEFNYLNTLILQKINLATQNISLKEARDILLPRLMSGEIEVQ